jgi:hypothetical protein
MEFDRLAIIQISDTYIRRDFQVFEIFVIANGAEDEVAKFVDIKYATAAEA